MKKYAYLLLPAAAASALALSGPPAFLAASHPFPPPDRIREVGRSASGDALALSLGFRRLAADVWFIRLMQYYGAPPEMDGSSGPEPEFGGGTYPDFLPIARHILALDPYFTNAGLYASASLAFNLSRPAEAVSLLNEALLYHPREWRYVTLLAAIGYSKASDPAKVARLIMPLIMEPDCPVMLRQLAAFLNKKAGNYRAASLIYKTILETTRDQFYIDNARKELARLEGMQR
ncbi:MAG: hypothetical protein A2X28_09620 [Elusimicrobia bacterium GWA2_56_46]|nr:MAG: hypothetical protein A2X28_09620 [Elusimicrobia bacterium GWA2_56_46]OGR54072.1 MAG: hypothetical protein A2X39_03225 [Elusimicrobia bacterium GWC2_56_31]HBB66467.1 hypothetical protein [Elusimicrobiota bacterium]HBW22985.1 hypothetical protein [Elusimicrobiota bacterium]